MIRSTIIYEFVVWHIFKKIKNVKTSINKFNIMQNKCLRTIIKAFKVILISMLETKIYIFSSTFISIKYKHRLEFDWDSRNNRDWLLIHVK
jgi:hypothetical protein